jgi:sugar/nucleoside kinase (ribokinase family)
MMRRGSTGKVVGVGHACLDLLLTWRSLRAPILGNRVVAWDLQGGGMVATALAAVTRLGGRAEFWGIVGTDWAADLIVDGLKKETVDTRHVVRLPGKVGPLSVVCVDQSTGERRFLCATLMRPPKRLVGPPESLKTAGCLLIDHTLPASELRAARAARRSGVPVVSDLGSMNEESRRVTAYVDYVIASESCLKSLGTEKDCAAACRLIRSLGPQHVAITLGDRGVFYHGPEGPGELAAFDVPVADTTGAGDVFHGAFCYGLTRGFAFRENLLFSSAAAALKCRRLGGRAGIPDLEEVLRFLEARKISFSATGAAAGNSGRKA